MKEGGMKGEFMIKRGIKRKKRGGGSNIITLRKSSLRVLSVVEDGVFKTLRNIPVIKTRLFGLLLRRHMSRYGSHLQSCIHVFINHIYNLTPPTPNTHAQKFTPTPSRNPPGTIMRVLPFGVAETWFVAVAELAVRVCVIISRAVVGCASIDVGIRVGIRVGIPLALATELSEGWMVTVAIFSTGFVAGVEGLGTEPCTTVTLMEMMLCAGGEMGCGIGGACGLGFAGAGEPSPPGPISPSESQFACHFDPSQEL